MEVYFVSLQLFLGSAGSGKSYQLYREVIEQSSQNLNTNYLVIVPEQFTLQTQKDIVTMHPNHGVMNVDILSFMRFAYRIFQEIGGNELPILEDTGKSMVIRKVIAQKKKDLILFGSNVRKPGFINELKSLLSELYQYNLGTEDFSKMMEISAQKPLLKAKLSDIFTIYQGFQDFMKERYITAEELLVVLNQIIDESTWLKDSVICLDGFTGFTPSQFQILEKMMKYAKKVMITVTIDPRESLEMQEKEYQLFSLSKKTIQRLYSIAKENQIEIDTPVYGEHRSDTDGPYRFAKSPALASLERNLFRYPYECYEKETEELSIHAAKDRNMEIAFVAGEINRLVREEGYRYQEIAVVSGDVENYSRVIKKCFQTANIPCFIDYKREVINNPFAELLRSAIAIVNEDFSYESIFRYLRTGLTGIEIEGIDRLENYILATGIRGKKRWSEPFVRSYKTKEPVNLEQMNIIRLEILDQIIPLYETLKASENNIKDYILALYDLGIRLKVEKQLLRFHDTFINNNTPLLAKEFEQIYRIVMELYDQIILLLGTEHCNIKEFSEILETGLGEAKVGLIPPGVDEVVVGDTERTRLKDIKVVFFIGVNEGVIPKTIGNGGILSDMEREMLISNNIELAPTRRQKAFTDQFYIYLNMTKPQDKLYVTYYKVNEEGKSVNPSFLIGKLQQLFKKIKIYQEDNQNMDLEQIFRDQGVSYLAEGFRDFQTKETTDLWKELYLYYKSNWRKRPVLEKLMGGAFYINKEKGISKEAVKFIYGQELKGSVTRLERYASCAFAHFLSYGLSLEERQEYKLAIPDIGNIFHNAIDEFSKRLDSSEYSWHTIPDEIREEMARESVEHAVEEYENSYLKSTKRSEYLIKRIERITIRTLWALCNQIRQGAFEPMGYEMPFFHLPASDITLQGRIDRLDIYEDEEKVYVRVIDYKSGSTSYDIGNVYYGLQQQLAVYLNAAMNYMGKQYPSKEIVPSGIFYYHIDDPIVAKSDQAEDEIFKSLRMNGLANEDYKVLANMDNKLAGPDGTLRASVKSDIIPVETNKEGALGKRSVVASSKQIKSFIDYVNHKLVTDGAHILEGDVQINPYRLGDKTPCAYCDYRSACGFDPRLPGHFYRNLSKKSEDEMKEEIFGFQKIPE